MFFNKNLRYKNKRRLQAPKAFLKWKSLTSLQTLQNLVLENFLKKVYNFLQNEHPTIHAGRYK